MAQPCHASALVVAEDDEFVRSVAPMLARSNLRVLSADGGAPAMQLLADEAPILAIVAHVDGSATASLDLAQRLHRDNERCDVVFAPRVSSEALAVAALRAGCADYLRQPIAASQLEGCISRCLARHPEAKRAPSPTHADRLVSCSASMDSVKRLVAKVACSDANVLITGETGTGKELVARLIHDSSRRRRGPYICINCAALPDALLESELFGYERGAFTGAHRAYPGRLKLAQGGTLVLDEIGEMTPPAQAKLLRAIESREVMPLGARCAQPIDVRIVASTNQDPEALMGEKRFRSDLYFRLNVARIHLPPLRERKEDVLTLFEHQLAEFNRRQATGVTRVAPDASECLVRYPWPGNVRELRNVVEAIFIDPPAGEIALSHLPPHIRALRIPGDAPERERERLIVALAATRWNKSEAAKNLRWSRMTLYRKLSKYHIKQSVSPPPLGRTGEATPKV